jgi:hypothetical protein
MIRDVIILHKSGVPLFYQNFGQCHSFGQEINLISGFISAIQMFSEQLAGSQIEMIELMEKKMAFSKSNSTINAIICDKTDTNDVISVKIKKVTEIFENEYKQQIKDFNGNIALFDKFGQVLIDLNITQKNCGGRPECEGCPNSSKSLPLQQYIEQLYQKRGLWQRIKAKFGK